MQDMAVRIGELENQLVIAKIMARRCWTALTRRVGREAMDVLAEDLTADACRIVDVAFDAAQIIWERHRILVEPCRRVLDAPKPHLDMNWPTQPEAYLAHLPGGETRNLSRAQLLMMAGMDADA